MQYTGINYDYKLIYSACKSILSGFGGTVTFSGLDASFGMVIFLNILATNAGGAVIANITRQVRLGNVR